MYFQRRDPAVKGILLVHSVQSDAATYMVLDLLTPGGGQYKLGYLADVLRMCIALSRARDGLVIVGSFHAGQCERESGQTRAWTRMH